jgi:methylthioribulose-1-phosphate dehydratase
MRARTARARWSGDRVAGAGATAFDGRRSAALALCRAAAAIGARGWCQGTAGNFSVTLDREPLRLLITRSGRFKQRLTGADLMLVGADGAAAEGEAGRPSAETPLHCAIASVAGAGAVLHTHSVAATLLGEHFSPRGGFTIRGYEMLKGLDGVASHEAEVFVPVLANSQDVDALSRRVRAVLGERPGLHGFLLGGHGLYTWGESLAEAVRHLEIFEFLFDCLSRRIQFQPFTG